MAKAGTVDIEVHRQDVKSFADYKPKEAHERDWSGGLYSPRIGRLHQDMMTIAKRLLTMWVDKVKGYGPSRYDRHELDFDAWMCFSDIHRKVIRLEQLTRAVAAGDEQAMTPLVEAYADIALYGMSNIHILEGRR